ncbi:MAG: tetratricopeptide repeat protein, partial [Bacteroidales bacterium]|nr:tetratricopeptide repeat protein [Bacteroidales bacterium]
MVNFSNINNFILKKITFAIFVFLNCVVIAGSPQVDTFQLADNRYSTAGFLRADSLVLLGSELLKMNEFKESILYFKKASDIYAHLNAFQKQATVYHKIGNAYFMLGENTNAIEYFYSALNICENISDTVGLAISYNSIATINASQGNFDLALDFYEKAVRIELSLNNTKNVASIYNNIGNVYNDKNQNSKALEFYEKAYSIVDTSQVSSELAKIIENIASQYSHFGNYAKSETYYYRALDIAKQINDLYLEAHVLANIADTYFKQMKYMQAIIYTYNSLQVAQKIDAKKVKEINYLTLTRIYANQCNIDSIQKYSDLYLSIHDSIYSEYSAQKLAELNVLYNSEKNRNEIDRLRLENKFRNDKYNALKKYMWIISIGGVLIVFIGVFYFILLWRKLKADSTLVQKSLALSLVEEKLEELNIKYDSPIQNEDKISRYAASTLSEDAKTSLEYELYKLMKKERLFLNNSLTINDIAKRLQTSRSYVSQTINEKMGKNFTQFINEYRIKEAIKIFSTPESSMYTIESIAQKVG